MTQLLNSITQNCHSFLTKGSNPKRVLNPLAQKVQSIAHKLKEGFSALSETISQQLTRTFSKISAFTAAHPGLDLVAGAVGTACGLIVTAGLVATVVVASGGIALPVAVAGIGIVVTFAVGMTCATNNCEEIWSGFLSTPSPSEDLIITWK